MDDAVALLRLEMQTLWTTDADGRLERMRTAEGGRPPLLAVAASRAGLCWAMSVGVPTDVRDGIARILSTTAGSDAVGWEPETKHELLELLGRVGPLRPPEGGPSFLVPRGLRPPTDVEIWSGGDDDRERLRGRMLEHDRATLLEPWAAVIVDGRVAAVCETARSAPGSVEAGLWTYEPFRRAGLGTAAAAAWAGLVEDRMAFYSTSWANDASRGVARRLELRPLGQWWQVHAASAGMAATMTT
jgi:hypothetical protein